MEKYFDSRLSQDSRKGAADVWALIAQDIIESYAPAAKNVLDLGAGYGDFINGAIADERWAVDQWPRFTEHLAQGVRGIVGDIREPLNEIPTNHFDLIFMSNVLEHFTIEDAERILNNAQRWLKPSGMIVLLQPNFTYCGKNYFDDYTHKTIFTAEGLSNFLKDNAFEVVRVRPKYLPFSFKSRLPRPLWAVKLYLKLPLKPLAAQMLLVGRKSHVEKQNS